MKGIHNRKIIDECTLPSGAAVSSTSSKFKGCTRWPRKKAACWPNELRAAARPRLSAPSQRNHLSVDAILINDEIDFPSTATPASCGSGMLKRLLAAPFNAKAKPSMLTM